MATFTLGVSHAQLAVFDSRLTNPFNDWTDAHVGQGFSWRPGSVSFAILETAVEIDVIVDPAAPNPQAASDALRVIAVPFTVPAHGEIEIATIIDSVPLQLPAGEYELVFVHGLVTDTRLSVNLGFRAVDSPVPPRIVVGDPGLSPPPDLVMEAEPA